MAWAIPQAMERSDATPTISARLPLRNPMCLPLENRCEGRHSASFNRPAGNSAALHGDRELLTRAQRGMPADAVPVDEVGDRYAKHLRNARQRIAIANLV